MADPHNKERYGEIWDSEIINSYLYELEAPKSPFESLRPYVIMSGGWAWHFMSPMGHVELKHAHDHKDLDIFVMPENVSLVINLLNQQGFKKIPTRFDGLPNNDDFRRYEKIMKRSGRKLVIDFFVRKDIQVREVQGFGVLRSKYIWKIVDPKQLLTFYKTIHSSDNCFAVKAADILLRKGIDPVGRPELVQIPK
jgi:hypothetical protein